MSDITPYILDMLIDDDTYILDTFNLKARMFINVMLKSRLVNSYVSLVCFLLPFWSRCGELKTVNILKKKEL